MARQTASWNLCGGLYRICRIHRSPPEREDTVVAPGSQFVCILIGSLFVNSVELNIKLRIYWAWYHVPSKLRILPISSPINVIY